MRETAIVEQFMLARNTIDITALVTWILIFIAIGLLLASILIVWVVWRIKRINLPEGADLMTALLATPLSVVIILDLLDFSLDFLSAPLAWTLLSYLGLKPLRGVTVVESLIPGTQFLPTMTIAWALARWARSRNLSFRL